MSELTFPCMDVKLVPSEKVIRGGGTNHAC